MNIDTAFKNLFEVASINAGHPLRGSLDNLPSGNIYIAQMRDALDGRTIDWENAISVNLPDGRRKPDWLQHSDILLATRGSNHLATLVIDPPKHAVAAPVFFVIRIKKPNVILPEFLCWQMNQKNAQNYFQSEATGSHILNLRRPVVEALPVSVPDIKYQIKIVELATSIVQEQHVLETLIANRQKQMSALSDMIMQKAGV